MAISPFQFPETILHPQQFTTEPPKPPTAPDSRNHPSKQFTTKPPTATHSSDDVEGRNHHPILLLAEPASSFAVVERPRHRVLTRRRLTNTMILLRAFMSLGGENLSILHTDGMMSLFEKASNVASISSPFALFCSAFTA
ncbi:uncharacterized protein DS421_3g83480 [Arachis hypogaea]|nr:uncharacterized protein DS421_3g83480 [Arachis hypogaea]